MNDAPQHVGAFLRATAATAVAVAATFHLGLRTLELLVGDQGLVPLVGFDPFLGAAPNYRPDALLVGARVEPVPVEATGVGGVFEHRLDRRLRPLAGGVAFGIDMVGGRRATGPIQVIGDLLVAGAGEEAVEYLGDHGRALGVGNEARLRVTRLRPRRVRMRLVLQPIPVGRPPAVAIALPRVLLLTAPNFAPQLLDLELIERLEHVADQPSLRTGLIAGGERIEDLYSGSRHLALVGECVEQVAAEARGRVDDHRVEASGVGLLRLAQ
ncbi:MAG TPA: hypothetical protein VF259_03390 [Solirubrobacterales bacterium]